MSYEYSEVAFFIYTLAISEPSRLRIFNLFTNTRFHLLPKYVQKNTILSHAFHALAPPPPPQVQKDKKGVCLAVCGVFPAPC
jgi:hypothetical protein